MKWVQCWFVFKYNWKLFFAVWSFSVSRHNFDRDTIENITFTFIHLADAFIQSDLQILNDWLYM